MAVVANVAECDLLPGARGEWLQTHSVSDGLIVYTKAAAEVEV